MMHLISEIPDPAAYGANDLTRFAAVNAKSVCKKFQYRETGTGLGLPTANII